MRVFVHKDEGKNPNEGHSFLQIPAVGEFVSLTGKEPDMTVHRVEFVLHCPFNLNKKGRAIYDAEIWVSAKSLPKVLKKVGAI